MRGYVAVERVVQTWGNEGISVKLLKCWYVIDQLLPTLEWHHSLTHTLHQLCAASSGTATDSRKHFCLTTAPGTKTAGATPRDETYILSVIHPKFAVSNLTQFPTLS